VKGLTTINKVKKEQVEKRTYLAVDIGASSGRIMKSQRLANGQITIEVLKMVFIKKMGISVGIWLV